MASSDTFGIVFTVGSEVLLATVNTTVKYVDGWTPQRIMVIRFMVDMLICAMLCAILGYKLPDVQLAGRLLIRGCTFCGYLVLFWMQLHSCLPLGDGVVILVATCPVFTVALCKLILSEEIPTGWLVQTFLCTVGALLVHPPTNADLNCPASTSLFPIGAAFCGGLMILQSRELKEVPSPMLVLFTDIVCALYAMMHVLYVEQASPFPSEYDRRLCLVLLAAVVGWFGLQLNVMAYQTVSVAAIASIASYSCIPVNYIVQIVVFQRFPNYLSVGGALIVVATNVVAVWMRFHITSGNDAAAHSQKNAMRADYFAISKDEDDVDIDLQHSQI